MKTLLIYATSHGCTAQCAKTLHEKIEQSELADIKLSPRPDLSHYDTVIVGGSIHAGSLKSSIRKFCSANEVALLEKKLGLFICCMETGDTAQKQFDEAYPEKLRTHATANGIFGGEFNFERMNFIERAIVKKVAKVSQSVSQIDETAIDAFALKMTQ